MKIQKLNRYFEKLNRCIKPNQVGDRDVIKYFAKSEIMRPMFIVTYYPTVKANLTRSYFIIDLNIRYIVIGIYFIYRIILILPI